MDIKKSKLLLYTGITLLVTASLFFLVKIKTELKGYNRTIPPYTINVSGEGKVFVHPDIATVTIGVSREDKNFAVAQKEVTNSMNAIIAFLKESGIAENDQKTTSYTIAPQYDYIREGQKLRGYEVAHTLEIKIRDLEKVGGILSGVASRAANRIGSLQFTIGQPDIAKQKAREMAIKNAQEKAAALSKSLGVRLKKLVSYYESDGGTPPIILREAALSAVGGDTIPPPSVPAGENEIRINVSLTYEIR